MTDKETILSRINDLTGSGVNHFLNMPMVIPGTATAIEQQAWLAECLLVVDSALTAKHPFHKLATSYVAGGGQLGAQGMIALLVALRREIESGLISIS